MKSTKRGSGFTLVEIMVVVSLIGMLAVMAIPTFHKARARSQDRAVTNNLRIYATAAAQYMLDEGLAQAVYDDVVGPGKHVRLMQQVGDEDYNVLMVGTDTTRLTVTITGRTVNYDF